MLLLSGMILAVFVAIFFRLNQLLNLQNDKYTARADTKSTKT